MAFEDANQQLSFLKNEFPKAFKNNFATNTFSYYNVTSNNSSSYKSLSQWDYWIELETTPSDVEENNNRSWIPVASSRHHEYQAISILLP